MILRRLFSRKKLDADLGEEMREHLLERIEALVANGMPLSAARETAQREFGNLTLLEERARDVWRWPILETLLYDIRFGARRLRHSPGLSLICMLTLALGLGANLALFSLVQTVLLKPLPFEDPERLVARLTDECDSGPARAPPAARPPQASRSAPAPGRPR